MNNRVKKSISLMFLSCFVLSSCAVQSVIIKPGYDFSSIKRVAVIDFKDAAYYPNSGSMAAELFVKYLLKTGYNVIERSELDSILREYNLSAQGIIDRSQTKEFGKIAGVDAIITGSIPTAVFEREYYINGNVRYVAAQAGITCRMISVETGEILWAGSNTYDAMNMQTAFEYLISSIVKQFIEDVKNRKL